MLLSTGNERCRLRRLAAGRDLHHSEAAAPCDALHAALAQRLEKKAMRVGALGGKAAGLAYVGPTRSDRLAAGRLCGRRPPSCSTHWMPQACLAGSRTLQRKLNRVLPLSNQGPMQSLGHFHARPESAGCAV